MGLLGDPPDIEVSKGLADGSGEFIFEEDEIGQGYETGRPVLYRLDIENSDAEPIHKIRLQDSMLLENTITA
jgi:hypothetical protein